jgi:hypothetical protein
MKEPIDMIPFVTDLARRPRGRAAVVLTQDYFQETIWAQTLAEKTKSGHVDLLAEFKANPDLAARLTSFTVTELFRFLGQRKESPVLVVNGLEFLIATWTAMPGSLDQFATQLEMWRSTPALLFVVKHMPMLAGRKFTRHEDLVFVVDQRDSLAL